MTGRRIETLKPITPESHPAFFREFHMLCRRHNMAGEWRITRQHTHFPLLAGEVLVERTDERRRVHTLRPVKVPAPDTIPAGWNVAADGTSQCYAHCTPSRSRKFEAFMIMYAVEGALGAFLVYWVLHMLGRV